MRGFKTSVALALLIVCLSGIAARGRAQNDPNSDPNIVPNALPYTLTFTPMTYAPSTRYAALPALHSYRSVVTKDGKWLVLGGRYNAGLHTFKTPVAGVNNFSSPNKWLWVIDPEKGVLGKFDVTTLPPGMAPLFQATNQESYYDRANDRLYVVGGYGLNGQGSYVTFSAMMRFSPTLVIQEILSADSNAVKSQKIQGMVQQLQDDNLAVTGGEMFRLNGVFYLTFGQKASGKYDAFGGSLNQQYTQQVRYFTLNPNAPGLSFLTLPVGTAQKPEYHRRDGNIMSTIDPQTGNQQIGVFGGVFPDGVIGAFPNPIYISQDRSIVIDTANQYFSAYNCPVIVAYDPTGKRTYHTFFGGISHYFYSETAAQQVVYKLATGQGRNDGLPFIRDISTFIRKGDGTCEEWILPSPVPGSLMQGTGAAFMPVASLIGGALDEEGIVWLNKLAPESSQTIGYIYGGITALNPFPTIPNTGTSGSNTVYKVTLNMSPSGAIPVSKATAAVSNGTPPFTPPAAANR